MIGSLGGEGGKLMLCFLPLNSLSKRRRKKKKRQKEIEMGLK